MHIISGTHKGRRVSPPTNFKARPTTDQAKEGLFNILSHKYNFNELTVADLFAGTGAISYEFISRGAKKVFTIELFIQHYKFIKRTINQLELKNIQLFKNDALKAIQKLPKKTFDIVFADPPFDMPNKEKIIQLVFENNILRNGILILEHSDKESYTNTPFFKEQRKYGKVCFSFFSATPTQH